MKPPGDAYAIIDDAGKVITEPKKAYPFLSECLSFAAENLNTIKNLDKYMGGFFYLKNDQECTVFKKISKKQIIVTFHSNPVNPFKVNTMLSMMQE